MLRKLYPHLFNSIVTLMIVFIFSITCNLADALPSEPGYTIMTPKDYPPCYPHQGDTCQDHR